MSVPTSHPRYESLMAREALVEALEEGYLAPQGLTAHGRGEAFDYLLGEETVAPALEATRVGAAAMVAAEHPVISVNGNVAALAPEGVAQLQAALDAVVEVNLFHRTDERVRLITQRLEAHGCQDVIGAEPDAKIPGLESARGDVCQGGIYASDCVLVPLEDGDRTEALVAMDKHVVTIDLNPLSRTARTATTTIVDNLVRALPNLADEAQTLSQQPTSELTELVAGHRNLENLGRVLAVLQERLGALAQETGRLAPE